MGDIDDAMRELVLEGMDEDKTSKDYTVEVLEFLKAVDSMTPGQRCFMAGYLQAMDDMAKGK